MKIIFSHTSKSIILLLLLGFGVFSFLHSELGLFNCDADVHDTHDYCQIIKNVDTIIKIQQNLNFSLEAGKVFSSHSDKKIELQLSLFLLNRYIEHSTPNQTTPLYLFNQTFLI